MVFAKSTCILMQTFDFFLANPEPLPVILQRRKNPTQNRNNIQIIPEGAVVSQNDAAVIINSLASVVGKLHKSC